MVKGLRLPRGTCTSPLRAGKLSVHFIGRPDHLTLIKLADQRITLALWVVLVVGLAVGSVTRQAIWLLALLGLPLALFNGRRLWQQILWRRWLFWWSLFAIPALLSMFDAVDAERGWRTVVRLVSYLLMGAVLFHWSLPRAQQPRFLLLCGAVLSLLLIDGILQFLLGFNLGGEPLYEDIRYGQRVTGFLGVDYGWVIAALSPFLLEAARLAGRRGWWFWWVVPLALLAVLLSGSRASALLMVVGWVLYLGMLWVRFGRKVVQPLLLPLLVSALVAASAVALDADLAQRWEDALGIFAADANRLNAALSLRPELWSAAWSVFEEHWINGVGLRSFGEVAAPSLSAVEGLPDKPQGWSPHLAVLEVAVNLGVIGVLAYVVFYVSLLNWLWRAPTLVLAPGLSAALAFFPLGSTLPLFSMRVASVSWLCLAMALSMAAEQYGDSERDAQCAE